MANNTAVTTSALKVVTTPALKVVTPVTPVLNVVTTPVLKVEETNGLVNSTVSGSDSNSTILTAESIGTTNSLVTKSNVTNSTVSQTNCSYPKPNPCGADTCYDNAVTYICKCRDGYVNKTPQSCELNIAEAKAGSDDDDDTDNTVYFLAGALGLVSLIVIASCIMLMVLKRKYNKAMKNNDEEDVERAKPVPAPTLKELSEPRPFFTSGRIKSPPPVRKAPSQVYSDVSTDAGSSASSSASGSGAATPRESSDESSED